MVSDDESGGDDGDDDGYSGDDGGYDGDDLFSCGLTCGLKRTSQVLSADS